jgi:hypothetical protein
MAERPKELRVSTPLVLAAASAMLTIGFVVWWGSRPPPPPPRPHVRNALVVDDRTPERAAQTFYDAWRRRQWPQALAVSVGTAHQAVLRKQARDAELQGDDRVVAERMWEALARAPLTLALDEADGINGEPLTLRGTAEYMFVNRPYRRRVEFVVVNQDSKYRVREMRLGEVLTELPALFRGTHEDEQP